MPLEIDFQFGRTAVQRGYLKQGHLEECIEVLVALERVGSRKRLWEIIEHKGYMPAAQVGALRREVEGEAHFEESVEVRQQQLLSGEETGKQAAVRLPSALGLALAHIASAGKAKVQPLPRRLVTLGRRPGCDIVLIEPEVSDEHAQIRCAAGKHVISDLDSGAGVFVNEKRIYAQRLAANDLIRLGSALLLCVDDYGEEYAPEPTGMGVVEGVPMSRLRITDGPRKGMVFFLGARPLVIGSHALANLRLKDADVSDFHAHIARTSKGFFVTDLKSRTGTRVNGLAVIHHALENGDSISVGPCALNFEILEPAEQKVSVQPSAAPAAERGEGEAGRSEWDISEDVELEVISDPMIKAGIKPMRRPPEKPRPIKAYRPGTLRLTCLGGADEGRSFLIKKRKTLIGRDHTGDIVLADVQCSRRHAEIILGEKQTEIRDLGSRNGVLVNGASITRTPLHSGDTIHLGDSLFTVEEVPPPAKTRRKC